MVFYRKYRPQKIDDLDNADIRASLSAVLGIGRTHVGSKASVESPVVSRDSTPHAFLFTGPKGLGKTSSARILAKAINCEISREKREKGIEPCNACDQCLSITNGTNLDVMEIDAASNRGIDEIRDLKEKIRLSPIAGKKKIYIIDEVHMLTTEAFNALLKTLEEPPEHAVFILCTTESHKVPSTILSRCFHLNFHLATEEELIRSFKRVVTGEKITITDGALKKLAELAGGGFRDGTKLLEEITMMTQGKEITEVFIEEKYQTTGVSNFITSLLEGLKKKDAKKSLESIDPVIEQGMDIKYFIEQLLQTLHMFLLIEVKVNGTRAPSSFTLEEIKQVTELFSKAYQETKFAVVPQLPLELAIIEYCQIDPQPQVQKIVVAEKEEQIEEKETVSARPTELKTVSSLRKQVGEIKKTQAVSGETAPKKTKPQPVLPRVNLLQVPAKGEMTKEWLDALWYHLIEDMKVHNHTIAGVLRSCRLKEYDTKNLVIETNYAFHKDRLNEMKTRDALALVAKTLTGKVVGITIELKK
ncbi:MAG: DNA polymerase III subunit gamma/tau [Patescibacteria group bacterium]